jgi:hypothetical protein
MRRYRVVSRRESLAAQGSVDSWHELGATLTVDEPDDPAGTTGGYSWGFLDSQAGTPGVSTRDEPDERRCRAAVTIGGRTVEVEHPYAMPPAIDLLLVMTADIATLDGLCALLSEERSSPFSTGGTLRCSSGTTSVAFGDAEMTGTARLAGRRSDVHSLRCLDRPFTIRRGHAVEQGFATSWATVHLDTETGALVLAELTEMTAATSTDDRGVRTFARRRRTLRAEPASLDADLVEAERLSGRAAAHIRQWRSMACEGSSDPVAELATMGFQSMVGTSAADAIERVQALRVQLRRWAGGHTSAAVTLRATLPEYRETLVGLQALVELSGDEGARLGVLDRAHWEAVQQMSRVARRDLGHLLNLLDRLESASG